MNFCFIRFYLFTSLDLDLLQLLMISKRLLALFDFPFNPNDIFLFLEKETILRLQLDIASLNMFS